MELTVGDHVSPPASGDLPDETYRVVGLPDGRVTLLRVTDGGRRASTGEVVRLDRSALDEFERATDPDAGVDPVGWIREGIEGLGILLGRLLGR